MTLVLTESIHEGAYIVSEAPGFQSRDTILIPNLVEIVSGTVLGVTGVVAVESATPLAAVDNAGNGTLAMDGSAPIAATAVDGGYTVLMTSPTAFIVSDPKGKEIGKGTVGTTYSGPIKFVVTAGATPFVQNDKFTVTVLRPDEIGDAPAPLAADGSVEAAGVLFTHVKPAISGTSGIIKAVMHARSCEVRASDLTWPAGFTLPQQEEAILQLKRRGIILR